MTVRKGWCPTLERPMESGDGYLVRITIPSGKIKTEAACEVARLSSMYGNGHIDLTSRANLQIRGVSVEHYPVLLHALHALGFTEETRPPRQTPPSQLPEIGYIAEEKTFIVGLPFGRIHADALTWLATQAEQYADGWIGFNASRLMWLRNITRPSAALLLQAEAHGFILHTHDARRLIEACPGAPACASAQGKTRDLALDIAKTLPHLTQTLHISGCAKGCACARKTDIVIVANQGGYYIGFDTMASAVPTHQLLNKEAVMEIITHREKP